ncbi:hypothetical protein TWF281_001457 [Arthrobotrys megalospora]
MGDFRYDYGNNEVEGIWVQDLVTAGDIQAYLQFGAATNWTGFNTPVLGLGLNFPKPYPRYEDPKDSTSFLDALATQEKIAGKVRSFYNVFNTNPGEIVLGGVDRQKFYGELDIYDLPAELDFPDGTYLVPFPTVRYSNITNMTEMAPPISAHDLLQGEIRLDPFVPHLILPQIIFDKLVEEFRHFQLKEAGSVECSSPYGSEYCVPCLPCDILIPAEYILELTFNKTTITLPFNDLIRRPPPQYSIDSPFCKVLFSATEGPRPSAVSLGAPFFNAAYVIFELDTNRVALAASVRNSTTRDIVEVGRNYSTPLSRITGLKLAKEITPKDEKLSLPVGILAGIGVVCGFVLVASILAGLIFLRRRRAKPDMPNMPSPVAYPYQLHSTRSTGELEAPKVQLPEDTENILPELPSEETRYELPCDQRRELELEIPVQLNTTGRCQTL